MEKENLMLGDLVIYQDEPCRVTILSTNGSIGVTDKRDATTVVQGKDLKCIPVTPEILEKNGFSVGVYSVKPLDDGKRMEYYHHEHRLRMWWRGVDEWQNHKETDELVFQCHVYFVHELQHAFKSCGIPKRFVL